MTFVNFSFSTSHDWDIDHPDAVKPLIEQEYYPFKTLIKESKAQRTGVIFQKCPAHTDFTKNVFVFCAPFDISLDVEMNSLTGNCRIFSENLNQEIFDHIIDTRFISKPESGDSPYPVIGIDWLCTFTCDHSMLMQVLPAFMHYNDFTNKATVIPGEYNIGKWTRPVELVFEIKNNREKITIKKGDAISYIKFMSDDVVKLRAQAVPWEQIKVCNSIRQSNTFRPLKERYDSLEKRKCPYESKN